MPENSAGFVGIGLSGSKLRLISSILYTRNSLNLSGRDSGEIFEGSIVSPNLPIISLRTEEEEFPRTTAVYNLMAKIIFLSLTDHV